MSGEIEGLEDLVVYESNLLIYFTVYSFHLLTFRFEVHSKVFLPMHTGSALYWV